MTKIKFCGMRTIEAAYAANEIKPDYVGFVLAPRFWRYISPDEARRIKAVLSPEIKTVGVFVDNPLEEVAELLESGVIDLAQLHGNEDDEFIKSLQTRTGKPIIKAFKIVSPDDVRRAQESPADYVLLDSGTGTGQSFDRSLIGDFAREYFLAGGLDPENVREAIEKCRPYAVDVSSGIETQRIKDKNKMKRFAEAVRAAKI